MIDMITHTVNKILQAQLSFSSEERKGENQSEGRDLPKVDLRDLKVGETLGSGGFASVYEVLDNASSSSRTCSTSSSYPQENEDSTYDSCSDDGNCDNDSEEDNDVPQLDCLSVGSSSSNRYSTFRSRSPSSSFSSFTDLPLPPVQSEAHSMALKKLHMRTLASPKRTRMGVQGLKNEANILSQIPYHDNIIKLLGTSQEEWPAAKSCSKERASRYFLLMERLVQTLDNLQEYWKTEKGKAAAASSASDSQSSFLKRSLLKIQLVASARKKKERQEEKAKMLERQREEERFQQARRIAAVGVHVANAMAVLHEHGILYRDLKPANVGLDCEGNVKLFDFGLALKLDNGDDTIVKGRNGTLRYMAPEVANPNVECRGFSSDVFSFGMVLYELLTLEKPYHMITDKYELTRLVATANGNTAGDMDSNNRQVICIMNKHYNVTNPKTLDKYRPNLNKVASPAMQELLSACWQKPSERPTFTTVVQALEKEIQLYQQQE